MVRVWQLCHPFLAAPFALALCCLRASSCDDLGVGGYHVVSADRLYGCRVPPLATGSRSCLGRPGVCGLNGPRIDNPAYAQEGPTGGRGRDNRSHAGRTDLFYGSLIHSSAELSQVSRRICDTTVGM